MNDATAVLSGRLATFKFERSDEGSRFNLSGMSGLISAFCVYWLHQWWCCRTTNSAALKRVGPIHGVGRAMLIFTSDPVAPAAISKHAPNCCDTARDDGK